MWSVNDMAYIKASAMPFIGPEPFAGITVTTVQREVYLWAVNEQSCLWQNTAKCRQAKQLVKQPNIRLTKYALKLSRKDLQVLAGLLTGHADLNRHLTLMQVRNDEICPLSQYAEETTLHLLGKCCALINQRLEILGSHYLEYEDLALLHWRHLS